VTLGALRQAIDEGTVSHDDRVVLLVTGDGLKTPGLVSDRLQPTFVKPDADAILDSLGVTIGGAS
jgi:threonine synthase